MSSPGIRADLHLLWHTHTHRHTLLLQFNTTLDCFEGTKTENTHTQNHITNTFAAIKRNLASTTSSSAQPYCSRSVLTVSFMHWLAGPPLYSCSQSVSRTNAPALLASGLCSSAMQQHAHARTHTPNTQKFHKHTHSPHPPSLSFCSQRLTLIQCWVYLPTLLAGGVLRECVRQKVCLRAGVGGGQTVGGVRENTSQRTLICRGRRWVEGRVEDTQGSCIPTDTEEGFLLQPCKRWEKKRGGKKTERARASYFSDVESACAWDVCVYRVGNISRPRSYLQKALFIKRELRPCRLKSNQRRKFSWFVLKGLTSWSE